MENPNNWVNLVHQLVKFKLIDEGFDIFTRGVNVWVIQVFVIRKRTRTKKKRVISAQRV